LPVLTATDSCTDIGTDVVKNNCGIAVDSANLQEMIKAIDKFVEMDTNDFEEMRENSRKFLEREFQVQQSYNKIINA
jgi:glycosyltransferase involved in cell wall biosynthesis